MCLPLLLRSRYAPLFLRGDGVPIQAGVADHVNCLDAGECDMALELVAAAYSQTGDRESLGGQVALWWL
ncbi:hypothetical protein EAE99_004683 [Botrytis elliptica]|nr:hypothetical protein EAE99_004683 [Botrytis elliptica]